MVFVAHARNALRSYLGYGIRLTANVGCVTPKTSILLRPMRLNTSQIQSIHTSIGGNSSTAHHQRSDRYVGTNAVLSATIVAGTITGLILWNYQNSSTISNDAPPYPKELEQIVNSDDSVVWKGLVYPALDLAAATNRLRAEETSTQFVPKRNTSATRFDSVRLPSNNPSEDEKSFGVANVGDAQDWKFWGVYDGHAGWATARVLRSCLTSYVAQAIREAKKTSPVLSPEAIDNAIKAGFLKLDNEIMTDGQNALSDTESYPEALSRIAPAKSGSCALLALFDPTNATLRVACTGDSRAVLGRCSTTLSGQERQSSARYIAEALSVDQTGFNEEEVKRIAANHPDEPDTIDKTSGRLLGMAVTRAFGDHRWKWPLLSIQICQSYYCGTAPRPKYISPPYMTAEPEVTTTKINKGDFLIMASDGLWDHMSSDDAVQCVSMWIEQEKAKHRSSSATPPPPQSVNESSSQITNNETREMLSEKNLKNKWQMSYWYKGTPEHFVVEDKNAATHLVRNALGGSRRNLFCSVMSVQAPDSRNIRDDITVQVVFFGDVVSK